MCGIFGYVGPSNAQTILLDGLNQLEYRGYDSAGIAMMDDTGKLFLRKKCGPVSVLRDTCKKKAVTAHCGIGHVRWATHGDVTDRNSHPHRCGYVTLIHNGIIENHHEICDKFGFTPLLQSQTDSEVAAWLINHMYHGDPYEALTKSADILSGSYALCIMFLDRPNQIYCLRKTSPLVAAYGKQGAFVSSDLTALMTHEHEYYMVPEETILTLTPQGISMRDLHGQWIHPSKMAVDRTIESAQKNGYPHYMLKEIHDQPMAFDKTIYPRLKNGFPAFCAENIPDDILLNCENIAIIACGTALYAGAIGKAIMEKILQIPVTIHIASEFRYAPPLLHDKTLILAISQSGETIDTLAALQLAKTYGSKTIAIVNVKGSSIARESHYMIDTQAGPEIAVASTKAYTVQIATLYLLACHMAMIRDSFTEQEAKTFIDKMRSVSSSISLVLRDDSHIKMAAEALKRAQNAFYIGRGIDYALAQEGALKCREISYIHAHAYAAGELKHGTIALIEKGTPVIAIATQNTILAKTISNIREAKARGAFIILITKANAYIDHDVYDIRIDLPIDDDLFAPFPAAVAMQLLAYHTSVFRGLNVDKPRNLAKSVTVE